MMFPKSVHDMLRVRNDWRQFPAGSIAIDLAQQVADPSNRVEFWRHLIGAALDGMVECWRETRESTARVEEHPARTWRINQAVFVYLPEIDSDFLDRCSDLVTVAPYLTILTPPLRHILLHKVLVAMLDEKVPSVTPVDTYLSSRVFFSQADLDCTHEQAVLALLMRYNERSLSAWPDGSVLVEMPAA
jgi:hypothetical protein